MKITEQDVRYVAMLANLALKEEEIRRFAHDLNDILTYADMLNEVDTSGVPPMAQVLYESDETATWREDCEQEPLGSDAAVACAPLKGAGYFKVPKVIER